MPLHVQESRQRVGVGLLNAVESIKQPNGMNNVRGIMSNLISLLLRAGWSPTNLFNWQDADGCTWTMAGVRVSPDNVAAPITKGSI